MLLALALLACSTAPESPGTVSTGAVLLDTAIDDTAATGSTDADPRVSALADAVNWDALKPHMDSWGRIAAENGGNRAAGTPGYEASIDYATEVFEGAGYAVERYLFTLDFIETGDTALEADGDTLTGFEPFYGSGGGDVTAPITAVDVLIPPSDDISSTSGCEADDFADFPAGNIALIQRGTCFFIDKVDNAVAAGASAVIIFNEGNAGRTEIVEGVLDGDRLADVPVVGVSFAQGEAWVSDPPERVRVLVESELVSIPSWNLFAETTGGSSDHVVLVGGHLDSVPAGPGVNDDGSGSAFVLSLAETMAAQGLDEQVRVRFALWGAEELGLIGSAAWVSDMAATDPGQLDRLDAYLNFDMLASPNGVPFVYDGDGSAGFALFPPVVSPPGSGPIETALNKALRADGVVPVPVSAGVPSDSLPFQEVGVPTGGVFSGASNAKTYGEEDSWGGDANVAYDVCYHLDCDDVDNVDTRLFVALSRAGATVALQLALDATPSAPPANRSDWRTGPRDEALARWHDHGPGRHCGGAPLPPR
jgi:Zn-dependent M28 family amino/carboxypeptidase